MNYIETELLFVPKNSSAETRTKDFSDQGSQPVNDNSSEILGIRLRLGERPLAYNLEEFSHRIVKDVPMVHRSGNQDYYIVVHAISAVRTHGKAKVDELQYFATALEPAGFQTIDLIPKTRFNKVAEVGLNLSGALDLFGEFSLDIPSALVGQLLPDYLNMGTGLKLQLSSSARFVGSLTYNIQIPVIQASGIGSGACSWILRPDEEKLPLLGDQLLVQSIAVPKGTKILKYNISGLVKADKGLLWKQQQKSTADHMVEVNLDQNSTQHI